MVDFNDDFKEFLARYDSTAAAKVRDEKTPQDVLNSIYSAYISTFETWEKVPAEVRNRYTKVPQDIMDAAARGEILTLREMEYNRDLKRAEDARSIVEEKLQMPSEITNTLAAGVFVAAISAGYSAKASLELALHRQVRESLASKVEAGTMTDKDKKEWRESREQDLDTIKRDWVENRPEKMLLHLFAQYNRGQIAKKDFLPRVAEYMDRIDAAKRREKLLDLLKTPRTQAMIYHFKDETRDLLWHSIEHKVPQNFDQALLKGQKRSDYYKGLSQDKQVEALSQGISRTRENVQEYGRRLTNEQLRENTSALVRRQENVRSN